MKVSRYKPVPTEEKIIGCRMLGIKCDEKTFMPDSRLSYAVAPGVFDGFCVIYQDNFSNAEHREARIDKLIAHLKDKHKVTRWDATELKSNAQWLTWNPMFNRKGFDKVKSYIMLEGL